MPLEVNVVLIGFNGDGGYRYTLDPQKLESFLKSSFPTHRPSCLQTGEPIDIEHHIVYNAILVSFNLGQHLILIYCQIICAYLLKSFVLQHLLNLGCQK